MPAFTVGTIDIGADNKQNLLAAINAQNGTTYTLDEYDFTDPKRVVIPSPLYNSSIKLGPKASTGTIGFKTIYYNRIHVSDIGQMKITWQNEQFLTELLPRLSEKYGIPITTADIFEQRILPPVAPETEVSLTLNFKETSVAYYGGGYIVLGANDPAIEFELPQTLPFKNHLVFYVNNFIKNKVGDNYLESSILSIASDSLRSRTLNVTNIDTTPYANIIKNTYTDVQRVSLEQYLPLVFSWVVGETKIIRGINIYGDIIEIDETSSAVEKKSSLITVDPLNANELETIRSKIMVREGFQDAAGNIYVIVGNPVEEKVKLFKSSDDGLTFNVVTLTTTNMASFNYVNWQDIVIHDVFVIGNKLSILVTNPNTYGNHPIKRPFGPAVEEFNLDTGASTYYPINPEFITNTAFSVVFNNQSKLRFVTPRFDDEILDVVAIARTSKTLEPVTVYCTREPGLEFKAEVIGTEYLDNPIFGLSAFSKGLSKDPAGKFVAIEILSIVPTSTRDDFFLMNTNIKGEHGDMGYGIITICGIRKGNKIGGWEENVLDIGGGSQPTAVTVTNKGKRNHYVFAGNNGIYNCSYSETSPNVFIPYLNKVFDVGSHVGFNLECDIGNGDYVIPEVIENTAMVPIYNDISNDESFKLPIGFSFLVKNKVTNQVMWLTAPDHTTVLQERTFSEEYRHMGNVPVAVFTDSSGGVYAWTSLQGIYKSEDQGNSWTDFSAVKSYYKNVDYLGQADIKLKAQDFKSLSVFDGIVYAQVNPKRTLEVFNKKTLDPDFELQLSDNVIYKIDTTKPAGATEVNTAFITTGLNNTSHLSPRNVIGWDTDIDNNIRAVATYTEEGVLTTLNQIDIPDNLVETAIDIYSDVAFLGLKAIVLSKSDADGSNLYFIKEDDTVVRHGLQFASTPTFSNFSPVCIQPIWDGNDDVISYTPIIITSTSKNVLVLERDGLAGSDITVTNITMVVPDDNSKPIKWVNMFNSNRRDRLVFQEDNGLFRVVYSWNGADTVSTISLVKLFSTALLNVSEIYSGCEYNLEDVMAYNEVVIGPWEDAGTLLGVDCQGFTSRHKFADGFGGTYWKIMGHNSPDCGYVVPTPTDIGPGGGNFNVGP